MTASRTTYKTTFFEGGCATETSITEMVQSLESRHASRTIEHQNCRKQTGRQRYRVFLKGANEKLWIETVRDTNSGRRCIGALGECSVEEAKGILDWSRQERTSDDWVRTSGTKRPVEQSEQVRSASEEAEPYIQEVITDEEVERSLWTWSGFLSAYVQVCSALLSAGQERRRGGVHFGLVQEVLPPDRGRQSEQDQRRCEAVPASVENGKHAGGQSRYTRHVGEPFVAVVSWTTKGAVMPVKDQWLSASRFRLQPQVPRRCFVHRHW